jgi:hypothetical protein
MVALHDEPFGPRATRDPVDDQDACSHLFFGDPRRSRGVAKGSGVRILRGGRVSLRFACGRGPGTGGGTTVAPTLSRSPSTVHSTETRVPGFSRALPTEPKPTILLMVGPQQIEVARPICRPSRHTGTGPGSCLPGSQRVHPQPSAD